MSTLTYSEDVKGWPSFYSFIPERMIGMNNRFFTFKDGNLWLHNSDTSERLEFYEEPLISRTPAHIEGVINEAPHDVKTFKTFVLESTAAWDTEIESDLGTGFIDASWYSLKEGDYFAHIRRTGTEFDFRSALGLSEITDATSDGTSYTVTMEFNVDGMVSIGDVLYEINVNTPVYIGVISNIVDNIITVTIDGNSVLPTVGRLGVAVKNSTAESYGTTGYYLKYKVSGNFPQFVELFAIGSNLFKSYP